MNNILEELRNRFPETTSSFREIRSLNGIYVDKTPYIHKMLSNHLRKAFFLSRPRRFGKSLLLSTLEELFSGNEELFRDLYIHDKWNWSQKFPVIHLDFSDVTGPTASEVEEDLLSLMDEAFQMSHQIKIDPTKKVKHIFKSSIFEVYKQTGCPVIILIDEYDIPVLSTIMNSEECAKVKRIMHDFFQIIKKMGKYIRFVMLTGIAKFSGLSVFSALNNLVDISLKPEYSAICGYTEKELEQHFSPFLELFDRNKFRDMYNGYNWLGESVYNPIDVMKTFDWALTAKSLKALPSFWFETGTPTFLVEVMKERGLLIPDLSPNGVIKNVFSEISIKHLSAEALLFQTGYLTIAQTMSETTTEEGEYGTKYRLKYPNREVQLALSDYFLQYVLVDAGAPMKYPRDLLDKALLHTDFQALFDAIHTFFARLSHDWYRKNSIASSEGFYSSVLFTMFAAVCNHIEPESPTNRGQIDMFVSRGDKKYIFEVKVCENSKGRDAISQIIEKGYAEKYHDDELYLVGIEFSREKRNIVKLEYCKGVAGERINITADEKACHEENTKR